MSTTSLFIEILLTGLQATIWLVLAILCFLGVDWIILERIKGFEAMITASLLPIVYPLGVVIDYLADKIFRAREKRIRGKYISDPTQSAMDFVSRNKDTLIANHLGYLRSRIRVSRASAVNFALMAFWGMAFVIFNCRKRTGFPFWRVLLLESTIGFLLSFLSVLAWSRITDSFFRWVAKGYNPSLKLTDDGVMNEMLPGIPVVTSQTQEALK